MSENRPLVSIITINFNQPEVTCEMLDSVRRLSYPNLEVIVVDNASRENPQELLTTRFPEITYIRSEKNLGFSGGNNLGIKASQGDYLFFVNNDTELIEGSIEQLLKCFKRIDRLGAVSPLIYHHPDVHQQSGNLIQYAGTTRVDSITARNQTLGAGELDRGQYAEARPTAYLHGAAMLLPREVVEKVGMMPEVFFLYYEELDWSDKIREQGYEIYVEPRAKIYHKESVSVGKMSTLKTYYLNRNRMLYIRRNRSGAQRWLFTLYMLFVAMPKNLILHVLRGEMAHARAFVRAVGWNFTLQSRKAIKALPPLPRQQTTPKTKV